MAIKSQIQMKRYSLTMFKHHSQQQELNTNEKADKYCCASSVSGWLRK